MLQGRRTGLDSVTAIVEGGLGNAKNDDRRHTMSHMISQPIKAIHTLQNAGKGSSRNIIVYGAQDAEVTQA